jgi:hypothetical protein
MAVPTTIPTMMFRASHKPKLGAGAPKPAAGDTAGWGDWTGGDNG